MSLLIQWLPVRRNNKIHPIDLHGHLDSFPTHQLHLDHSGTFSLFLPFGDRGLTITRDFEGSGSTIPRSHRPAKPSTTRRFILLPSLDAMQFVIALKLQQGGSDYSHAAQHAFDKWSDRRLL